MDIQVVILHDNGDPEKIKSYFVDSRFKFITIKPNEEHKMIKEGLTICAINNPDSLCLLIKDTSVSIFTPTQINEYLNVKFDDVLYLSNWQDTCQLYRDEYEVLNNKLVTTYQPRGLQALLLSPKARDVIRSPYFNSPISQNLTNMIYNDRLKAKTYLVNIFDFDIKYADDSQDFMKLNRCSDTSTKPKNVIPFSTYFYVISIVTLIVIAVIGMYKLGPEVKELKSNNKDKKYSKSYTYIT